MSPINVVRRRLDTDGHNMASALANDLEKTPMETAYLSKKTGGIIRVGESEKYHYDYNDIVLSPKKTAIYLIFLNFPTESSLCHPSLIIIALRKAP